MNAYSAGLVVHNSLRWLVLLAGVTLCARTITGWLRGRPWERADERLHAGFVGIVDLQMLAGLILYAFLSPLPVAFLSDVGGGMKVSTLRFFMLDHPVAMIAAITIVHAGRSRSMRAATARTRHRTAALSAGIGLIVMLASIPWPGLRYGRPILRLPGVPAEGVFNPPVRNQPDERHHHVERL